MTDGPQRLISGRYELISKIGEGGMGRVWRGFDRTLERTVAVKEVLLSVECPPEVRRQTVERALREARAAARLSHKGIVTVYDIVEHDEAPWIVMEYIEGESLGLLSSRGGAMHWWRAARIGAQVAEALAHAHTNSVIHRDLKPDNILMAGDEPVVTDFGMARILDSSPELSRPGTVPGTPLYMAPEQLNGNPTAASDLWSLGVTLYRIIECRDPFWRDTPAEIFAAILRDAIPPAQRAGPLSAVLRALLARDPRHRPNAVDAARLLSGMAGHGEAAEPADLGWTGQQPVQSVQSVLPVQPIQQVQPPRPPRLAGPPVSFPVPQDLVPARHFPQADPGRKRYEQVANYALTGHAGPVRAVALARDGRRLVSSSDDGTVRLWDLPSGTSVALQGRAPGQEGYARARFAWSRNPVSLSPDGRILATGGQGNTVCVWDAEARTCDVVIDRHAKPVLAIAFSPNGQILATADGGGGILLWAVASGVCLGELPHRAKAVFAMAFSPDNRILATGGDEDSISLWSVGDGCAAGRIPHAGQTFSLQFSLDGAMIVSTCAPTASYPSARLWAATSQNPVTGFGALEMSCAAFSRDGKTVATGCENGQIDLWAVPDPAGQALPPSIVNRTHKPIGSLVGHAGRVHSIALGTAVPIVASGGDDRTVRVWNLDEA
ncbi:MAG TPA: serine/threonine-protein kinase [Actinocrinis sp.]